jgi:ubiquinone/menaquinone biosynthesis C-methylase UbiE
MSNRKQLLAVIRKGDYAHAGEEEAIELSMSLVPKNSAQNLLDVGCGLGGTAGYLEKWGWGKVTGVDLDQKMITHAELNHAPCKFYLGNAENLTSVFTDPSFDVVYSFNAFFCFPKQEHCLNQMAKVTKENADLIIFDYASPSIYRDKNPFFDPDVLSFSKIFSPINLNSIEKQLFENNWKLKKIIDLAPQYLGWYQWLFEQMKQQKNELIKQFGHPTFYGLYEAYDTLINLFSMGKLSGTIIHAKRKLYED